MGLFRKLCLTKCDKVLNFVTLKMWIPILLFHVIFSTFSLTVIMTCRPKYNCQIILDFEENQ